MYCCLDVFQFCIHPTFSVKLHKVTCVHIWNTLSLIWLTPASKTNRQGRHLCSGETMVAIITITRIRNVVRKKNGLQLFVYYLLISWKFFDLVRQNCCYSLSTLQANSSVSDITFLQTHNDNITTPDTLTVLLECRNTGNVLWARLGWKKSESAPVKSDTVIKFALRLCCPENYTLYKATRITKPDLRLFHKYNLEDSRHRHVDTSQCVENANTFIIFSNTKFHAVIRNISSLNTVVDMLKFVHHTWPGDLILWIRSLLISLITLYKFRGGTLNTVQDHFPIHN
jgi:hypothetical protein